jgi:hypothetical protein
MHTALLSLLLDTASTTSDFLQTLLWPGVIAAGSYLLKSAYDLMIAQRNRQIASLEDRLKLFYWPILLRLEQNSAYWEFILGKRKEQASLEYRIGEAVESMVLKHHQETLTTIEQYIHLAEPDEELLQAIKQYTKNVTLYQAIRDAKTEVLFPTDVDKSAAYPTDFYQTMKKKTARYQKELDALLP